MKKTHIFTFLLALASPFTWADEVRIAFSKAENIEVFAKNPDANGQWCADNIEVSLRSGNPSVDYDGTPVDQLIAKVGGAVIEKTCPSASQVTVYRADTNTLLGAAMKNGQWAMIRDAANESEPPSEEEGMEAQVATSPEANPTSPQDNNQTESAPQQTATATTEAEPPAPAPEPAPAPASKPQLSLAVPPIDKQLIQAQLDEVRQSGKKDMPLTRENMQLFGTYFKKRADRYEMKVGEDEAEISVKLVKATIEEDMGYDFDLSFRRVYLFETTGLETIAGQIFSTVYRFIPSNLDESLKSGYISQRTYNVIQSARSGTKPPKETLEFLELVQECQNSNGGICTAKFLLTMMKNKGIIKIEIPDEHTTDRSLLNNDTFSRYKLHSSLGNSHLLVTINGEDFNPSILLDYDRNRFKLNDEAVEHSLNALKIYAEETEFFNQIPSIQATPKLQSGNGWIFWVILLSAVFVLIDAKRIGVRKGLVTGMCNMGPWSWFFGSLLLWIVIFPLYLIYRGKFKAAILAAQQPVAPPAGAVDALEKLAALKEKGHISAEEFESKKKQLLGV